MQRLGVFFCSTIEGGTPLFLSLWGGLLLPGFVFLNQLLQSLNLYCSFFANHYFMGLPIKCNRGFYFFLFHISFIVVDGVY